MSVGRVLAILALAACGAAAAKQTPEARAAALLAKAQADGGIAQLDTTEYNRFALKKEREYELFVLFTADLRHGCHLCDGVEAEFAALAYSYGLAGLEPPVGREEAPVVLAQMEYQTSPSAFKAHGLRRLPMLVHVPAGSPAVDVSGAIPQERSLLGDVTAEDMARFVRAKSGAPAPAIEYPLTAGAVWNGLLVVAAALSAGYLVVKHFESVLRRLRNKNLWLAASLFVYFISISGVVFDIIRAPPAMYASAKGIMFFHPQSGTQFVFEGLIIGGLNVATALVVVLGTRYCGSVSEPNRTPLVVGCCFAVSLLFSIVKWNYKAKTRWYRL